MDNTLKKLIFSYLDSTYKLTFSSLERYMVHSNPDNKEVSIATPYDDVKEVFNLHPYNCGEFFDEWIDMAALRLNNEMVDTLYNTYAEVRTTPIPNSAALRLRAIVHNN